MIHPVVAEPSLRLVLASQVRAQHQDGARVEGDDAFRGRGLGLALAGLPPVLHDLVGNLQGRRVQVRVRAPLTAALAPPQAGVGDQVEQRIQPVVHGEVQELAGQVSRPHHHRIRHLAGAAPLGDALRGPQLRLRPHRWRQLDQLGDIVGQQALVHRRPQDRPQRLLDPVQRCRPDRTLPLHRRHLLRVAAGPVFGDQLVALHDRLEHRIQMSNPQPVAPNLA
nr:hypothetical protein [Amycolatopsis vastitatis]